MKRGQRATHRMRYTWSSGMKGSKACLSLEEAQHEAEVQARRIGPNGETCTATVEVIR